MVKLCLENPFLFDFIKYETLRVEVDDKTPRQYSWVIWEDKSRWLDHKKVGCINGIMTECVAQGSTSRGLEKSADLDMPKFERNPKALSARYVYMSGRLTPGNLESLLEMSSGGGYVKERKLTFPGLSLVYQNEKKSQDIFKNEHKSRNSLHCVTFKI